MNRLFFSAVIILTSLRAIKADDVDRALFKYGVEVRRHSYYNHLSFHGENIPAADFSQVFKISNLQRIDLSLANVGDNHVSAIRHIETLSELILTGTKITDKAMESVRTNMYLQVLYVANTAISDDGVSLLVDLPYLKSLSLQKTKITSKALDSVNKLRSLRDLDLINTTVNDDAVAKLAKQSQLRKVWLAGTKITNKSLQMLVANNKGIVELDIQGCKLDDGCVQSLNQLRSLKKLQINGTDITTDGIHKMSALDGLEELWIGYVEDSRLLIERLKPFKSLKRLELCGTMPGLPLELIPFQIGELKNLEFLRISSACKLDKMTVQRIKVANPRLFVETQ